MLFKGVIFFLFFNLFLVPAGWGEEYHGKGQEEEPWEKRPAPKLSETSTPKDSRGRKTAEGLIKFFQNYISPVDGDRCPCYPTCSQYALEAIRKHGAVIGTVMAFDRLLHESDEILIAPQIKVKDVWRYYDPVVNNDFWWDKK